MIISFSDGATISLFRLQCDDIVRIIIKNIYVYCEWITDRGLSPADERMVIQPVLTSSMSVAKDVDNDSHGKVIDLTKFSKQTTKSSNH